MDMSYEIKPDYSQMLLFPPSVEDWVPAEHPARFIRDFVDALDLEALGFKVREVPLGRPNYSANLLLKVWLFGFLLRVYSMRRLEQLCYDNVGMIWLTSRNTPDHNTLHRFFRDNRKALRSVFRKSVEVAVKLDLVGLALHAVDGTKIAAASSPRTTLDRRTQEKLLARIDRAIAEITREVKRAEDEGSFVLPPELLDAQERRKKVLAALEQLDAVDRDHVHPNEPEARMIKNASSVTLSYNAQMVADAKSGIVVAQDVTNAETDAQQLTPMIDLVKENLGAVAEETLADGGYLSADQLARAEECGYGVIVPVDHIGDATNRFDAQHFERDEERDEFICPMGQRLTFRSERRRAGVLVRIYRSRGCQSCTERQHCTRESRGRSLEVRKNYDAWLRHRKKHEAPETKEKLRRRKVIIEPVFARLKHGLCFRRWTVRGLEQVRTEWALLATVLNLKKIAARLRPMCPA